MAVISSPVILLTASSLIFATLYRLYSQYARLAHIPGPFLAKFTNAWRCYQAWRVDSTTGDLPYQVTKISSYGDYIRIGPNCVLVTDPEAVSVVLGFKERLDKVSTI